MAMDEVRRHTLYTRRWRDKNRAEYNRESRRRNKAYRSKVRVEMIFNYGGKCVCCNEKEPRFLTLDHINNDGNMERRRGPRSSQSHMLNLKLRRLGWPKSAHQLMCWNCNSGRAVNGGICPHEEAKWTK